MKAAPKNPVEVAKEKGETNPSVDIKQTYDITSDGRGRTSEINPNMINSGDVFVSNASRSTITCKKCEWQSICEW